MKTSQVDSVEEILKRYERARNDPWEFLSTCVYTLDQVDQVNPIKRFPTYMKYLYAYTRCWENYPRILVPKSRRMTMSWTNIALYLWDTMFHKGRFNAFVSRKEEAADELIKRAEFIYEHIPEHVIPRDLLPKKSSKFCHLDFPETNSQLQGFPQGADQLRQFTFSGIFGDEMSFWEQAQAMYSASMPTLEGGGRFTGVSSPAPGFFKAMVHDELDTFTGGNPLSFAQRHELKSTKAESLISDRYPMEGVEVWINPKNRFLVFQLHYSANPKKRDPNYRNQVRAEMPISQYMQEYELQWDSFSGMPVYPDFQERVHGSKEKILPLSGLPLLRGWDFGLCYDDETEVLTLDGWKLFKDVAKTEQVATLDPETFEMRYETPKLKVEMPYDGDMIVWDSQNLQACVTTDHIVPVWKEDTKKLTRYYAKDLMASGHNLIRLTANWKGTEFPEAFGLSPKLFSAFMGAYLSEGSSDGIRVVIYQRDSNKAWLREIINATEWDWKEGKNFFRLYKPNLARYLADFGSSGNKHVPASIRSATPEIIAEFIRTYTLGDGHIRIRDNGTEEHTIYSKSKRMVDDLSELALKLGWTSSIAYIEPTSSYYEPEDRWIESTGGWNIRFKKTTDWAYLRETRKEIKKYEGMVYCLSVSTGILCVRKNGRPHWNGNTPACVVAQLQGDSLVVLWEKTSRNEGAETFVPGAIAECQSRFPTWSDRKNDWRDFADPSGVAQKDTDMGSCFKIMGKNGLNVIPGAVAWEPRRSSVESFLIRNTKAGPGFQINMADCPILMRGFKGGYRYPEKAEEIEPLKIRPLKDEHSHPHDALQMITSSLIRQKHPRGRSIPTPMYGFMSSGASAAEIEVPTK